ncbi:MAG: hypothetical protein K6E50_05690 [Lachnospiraceae bacterium]|nr:hypothetical protein [Lachnospiraceae bacterium]
MSVMIQREYSIQIRASYEKQTAQKAVPHPEWDPKKVYNYLEDMAEGFQSYKRQAVKFYQSDFAIKGLDQEISVEELKSMIKEYFPQYKLTDREPKEPVTGTYYLYIDQTNMNKLASDPNYRAKVFGLMDSELQGSKGYTLKYTSGKNVTNHIAGSIFSLAEANRSIDGVGQMPGSEGIPYRGSACAAVSCSKEGVAQVRSQAFIEQVMHPGKNIATRKAAGGIHRHSSDTERAEQRREEHKIEVRKRYREWLEEKTEADKLQERFLTDLSDIGERLAIFDTNS